MHQRTKIAVAVAMAINSMAVFAQATAPAEMARVEVTGSRIRAVDQATAQPILKVTQEQIQKSGLVTVGDILNTMTSSGTPDFSKGAVLTSNREAGGQYIDARNLGSNRLLVLVNGKRWTQTVAGFTDISTIPSSMIESIEILKDGASAIYGSDAIAGVINFILKKKLVGGQFSGYVGQNQLGDGKTQDWSLAYGANSDTASMMFGLTHTKQGPVYAKDRWITNFSFGPDHSTAALGAGPWGRIRQVNPTNGQAAGFNRVINHTGSYDNPGNGPVFDSRVQNNYHNAYGGGTAGAFNDSYNPTRDMMFTGASDLTSVFAKGNIDLPMDIRFSTTAMFATRTAVSQVAGYPLQSLAQVANPVYIDKNSYYNPYGSSVVGAAAAQDLFFYRRTIERPRITENKNDALHIDAGFEGDFSVNSLPWNWGVSFNYSKSSGVVKGSGNINLVNLKKALGPSFLDSTGKVVCGVPGATVGGCVPIDILSGPGGMTDAGFDFINHNGGGTYGSSVGNVNVDIAGELFTLPAGNVGAAFGVEKRDVRGFDAPNNLEQLALTTNNVSLPTNGKYSVKEAYLELNVPVLKNMFLAESLIFNVASRYSDYSGFGDTTNSKASFTWKPIKDLLVRGTVAEGFRAPSLGDTFGGGGQSFDTYLDVCDMVVGQAKPAGGNATIRAACLAAGVPDTYRQTNQAGGFVTAAGAQTTIAFNTGVGNNTLTPETAKTKTLGFLYNPSYLPGFTFTADWFNIVVENRVSAISVGFTLNQCYLFSNQQYCNNLKRDTTGKIVFLQRGNRNAGALETEGVDFGIGYQMPVTKFGKFGFRADSTYLDKYSTQSEAGAQFFGVASDFPFYRLKSNITVDWSMGNWSATFGTRYYSPTKGQCWDTGDGTPGSEIECNNPTGETNSWGTGFDKKPAQWYHDLSVGYAFPWKGKLLVGINNILDKKPRINYDTDTSASSVDSNVPIDRFMYVRYNQSF